MKFQIVDKATGKISDVDVRSIDLTTSSIVRADLARADVAALEREGNDLILVLTSGERIRIGDFYRAGDGGSSDLVLQDQDGSQWLAHPGARGAERFTLLHDGDGLIGAAAAAEGGGGGFVLPALLGLAGAGGVAALAAGGSGGSTSQNPAGNAGDLAPPDRPSAQFGSDGATLAGNGEAGATIQVRNAAGVLIGTGTVAADGSYRVTLDQPRTNGENVSVTQTDTAGNVSPAATATAPDLTAPAAPVAAIAADGAVITGTGEPGATVRVVAADGTTLGAAVVATDGSYSIALNPPQTAGGALSVTQADVAGNVSPSTQLAAPDVVAPAPPVVGIAPDGSAVSGTGEPGATVTVRTPDGTPIASGLVGADGGFTLPLSPAQANGGTVTVVQTDLAGNVSPAAVVAAPDVTPPAAPIVTMAADGVSVSGTGEPGATVTVTTPGGAVIATAIADDDGRFSAVLNPPQRDAETLEARQSDAAGNVSAAAIVTAPDLTAPLAPTAAVSANGTQVIGTGEPGATVTVRDAGGAVLGSGTVAADGSYAVTLTPAQTDSQPLSVGQADAAGNGSPLVTIDAPDLTAPDIPLAAIDASGAVVIGTGEPGATVTVRDADGTVLGAATVAANGAYAVPLATPLTNAETVGVVQVDAAGNASAAAAAIAPDLTPPAAPLLAIAADGTSATGTGEPGATVTIRDATGASIGTAAVAGDGSFAVQLSPAQTNGGSVSATQADAAGNVSPAASATAPDLLAPAAPTATLDATGSVVTGTGEPGATITVRDPAGVAIGTATVDARGHYSATLATPQIDSQQLGVSQADAAGNASPSITLTAPDLTPPAAPIGSVAADGATITGGGEPGATVTITDPVGVPIGTALVGSDGQFAATLTPPQVNGEQLQLTQADGAGNVSVPGTVTAPDLVLNDSPPAPVATVDTTGTIVSGTGQIGATIIVRGIGGAILATAAVDATGAYSAVLGTPQINGETVRVTQTDAEGDVSPPALAIAPDLTPPAIPGAAIDASGQIVTGTGEPGATVRVADGGGTVIATAVVGANGGYVAVLPEPRVDGETLSVTQSDAAGNVSPAASVTAPDFTAPAAPTASVSADGALVTGIGEPGATVTIRDATGIAIGTATVAADGSYAAALATPRLNGETLTATQADAAGNASPSVAAIAPDTTAPSAPTATVDASGTVVTGIGEPGATVTIRDTTGAPIGTAIVAVNGAYSAALASAQANGQQLQVTQADAAGNISPPTQAVAPDFTPPAAPSGIVAADGTTISGTGEAGATVTIRAADGTVIATAIVDGTGAFSAPLTPIQANGETLRLVQADATGNVSPTVAVAAPDITAPVGLTAAVDGTGTLVTGVGEPGASVTIRDAAGGVVGTATVAADGGYAATLSTAQDNGQVLQVTQTDAAGNISAPIATLAPDLVAPLAPIATVSGDGTTVSGTGEAGATLVVRAADGAILSSVTVAADGSFTAPLSLAQANGEIVQIVQTDAAGNASPTVTALAPDITPPALPTAAIDAAGATVTGTGEVGATVEVRDAAGIVIATATVGTGGGYAVALPTPLTAGEALRVDQRDPAGNVSGAVPLTAPFDIAAFDNSATASIDLQPFQADRELGSAAYLALVSLGLVNLDAQVLAVPSIGFTVAAGHTLDATFTYDATLGIGVLAGYSVVVQRFDGTNWVAANGTGSTTALELRLLDGNLVASETLGAGQYRAFVTFDGAAGVGLLGGLSASGVDSDFTRATAVPAAVAGNVVTDPGPGGAIDIVSPQTVVQSVTVGGTTTAVAGDATVVDGNWGTLVINRDGSYTYTPDADAAAIGQTDVFTYALLDGSDGEIERATLSIAIASPDITAAPQAGNDSAIATAIFENIVQTLPPVLDSSFTTPLAAVLTGPQTGSVTDSFTVGANSTANVTLSAVAQSGISVLPTYVVTVTDPAGSIIIDHQQLTAVAGPPLLGGTGVSLTLPDLPAGTYGYTISSTQVLGTAYSTGVYVGQTVTQLDQHRFVSATSVQGKLFANDALGSPFHTLQVAHGGSFAAVGDTPLTIAGSYGSLIVDAAGHYSYQPSSGIAYAAIDPVDSFTYQVVQPNGSIATAQLDIAIDINNGAAPTFSATVGIPEPANFAGPDSDVAPLGFVAAPAAALPDHSAVIPDGVVTLDDEDSIQSLLSHYLDAHGSSGGEIAAIADAATASTPLVDVTAATMPDDPLAYIATNDPDHERLVTLHAI